MAYIRDDLETDFSAAMQAGGFGAPTFAPRDHDAADALLAAKPATCKSYAVGAVEFWSELATRFRVRGLYTYTPPKPSLPLIHANRDEIRVWSAEVRGGMLP